MFGFLRCWRGEKTLLSSKRLPKCCDKGVSGKIKNQSPKPSDSNKKHPQRSRNRTFDIALKNRTLNQNSLNLFRGLQLSHVTMNLVGISPRLRWSSLLMVIFTALSCSWTVTCLALTHRQITCAYNKSKAVGLAVSASGTGSSQRWTSARRRSNNSIRLKALPCSWFRSSLC